MIGRPTEERMSPLRFGLMCYGPVLERWQARCLDRLEATRSGLLALLVIDERPPAPRGLGRLRASPAGEWVFHLWCGVVDRPTAFRPVDLTERLAGVPSIRCRVHSDEAGRERFDEADLLTLRRHRLDFLLQFAFGPLAGDVLNVARYGVWTFSYVAPPAASGPPGFAEIRHGSPVIEGELRQARGAGTAVLARGAVKTRAHSYGRTLDELHSQMTRWVPKACAQVGAHGEHAVDAAVESGLGRAPTPGTVAMLYFLGLLLRNALAAAWRQLFRHEQWTVGMIDAPIASLLASKRAPDVRWLVMPRRGEFLADPFGVMRGGRPVILCEHFLRRRGWGHIASLEPGLAPEIRPVAVDLGPPVHRSYPFLLEHEGEIFCVPETGAAREVGLYRALEFPVRWTKVATLLCGVAAADSTVLRHDGTWWLFCVDHDNGGPACLHLWYADDLTGPWLPHPCNPVKTDIRSARPAGTPFVHQGRLYRPAQDCSADYGKRVIINRVTCLSRAAFSEEPVAVVEPDPRSPFAVGLHTISAVGDLTVVDGKRTVFSGSEFRRVVARSVARWMGLRR